MPDTTPPRRRPNYLDNAELAPLVREYHRTGAAGDPLAAALLKIADGVWAKYRFTADRDDFAQDVVCHLLQNPLRKCDPGQNVFSYLTTCAIRYGMKLRDKAAGDRRRFTAYARHLADTGAPVADKE